MKRKQISTTKGKNTYLKTFISMQKKLQKANKVLAKDLSKKNIDWKKVKEDSTYIMLLLGECNYLEKECTYCKKKGKWA